MTNSKLQKAIDEAWPGIEAVVRAAAEATPAGKALTGLKEAFIQHELPATSSHLPPTGQWEAQPRTSEGRVANWSRKYCFDEARGLVDLFVSISLDADELDEIRLKKPTDPTIPAPPRSATAVVPDSGSTAPAAPASGTEKSKANSLSPDELLDPLKRPAPPAAVVALANAAVTQQINYAMGVLTNAPEPPHPHAVLADVVRSSREGLGSGALTALVGMGTLAGRNEEQKKKDRLALAGGTLIEVPWTLGSDVLLFQRKPTGVAWYTAFDRKVGWEAMEDRACISVSSRLLLDVPTSMVRYRRPFS